jgi:hypothetical protein
MFPAIGSDTVSITGLQIKFNRTNKENLTMLVASRTAT